MHVSISARQESLTFIFNSKQCAIPRCAPLLLVHASHSSVVEGGKAGTGIALRGEYTRLCDAKAVIVWPVSFWPGALPVVRAALDAFGKTMAGERGLYAQTLPDTCSG